MCGIAGFSLTDKDANSIDSRVLAGMLLINIEHRGRHATGAAWTETNEDGIAWFYAKQAVPAREFGPTIKQMPKHSRRALLHVRYATTGSPNNNDNNHPIVVPSESGGSIIGTHNGIINNYESLMDDHQFEAVGEVDSQAVFHLIGRNDFTPIDLRQIQGSAAIASVSTDKPTTITLARLAMRPLVIAQTPSGSTVWCSEIDALNDALKVVGLETDFEMEVPEWHILTVEDGRIASVEPVPNDSYTHRNRQGRLVLVDG
jgi:glucosamine 6-phosphate synthetase-like amidotransferase/phosphosugar isomerase protein